MSVVTTYIGVIEGMHTWDVRDADSGEMIGINQSPYPPRPGEGWVLDDATGTWVEAQ